MHRRTFLQEVALALPLVAVADRLVAAGQGLDRFQVPGVPCKDNLPTPVAADEATFKAKSPERTRIAEGVPGQVLILSGVVSGVVCGPIKDAVVDFWQPDAKGVYDMTGFTLRGRQRTDAMGVFKLETIVPGAPAGRARHLSVRVQAAGKPTIATQLFFPDDPGNAKDKQFKPELAMKIVDTKPNRLQATFNIILDA